jgi:coproporphyrinogen III oxidase-like Fe-S oxidoreductase
MNTVVDIGSDRRAVRLQELSLLGFIQLVGGAFEVTDLGRLTKRSYFSSFDRATASLASRKVLT